MKNIFLILVLLSAQMFAQSNHETVQRLIEVTKVDAELQQIDALISAKLNEQSGSFEREEDFNMFKRLMHESFNTKIANQYLMDYLVENTNEKDLKKVISLYEIPLMQEMLNFELSGNDISKQQEMMTFFQNMKLNPLPKERIQKLVSLNEVLGAADISMNMLNNVLFSMANSANKMRPKDKQLSEEELKKNLESVLPQNFKQQLTNQLVAMSMYVYKDASDEKLSEYIDLWKGEIGQYYLQFLYKGFDYSFSKMSNDFGKGLAKIKIEIQ